jgi:hypothetical protein
VFVVIEIYAQNYSTSMEVLSSSNYMIKVNMTVTIIFIRAGVFDAPIDSV